MDKPVNTKGDYIAREDAYKAFERVLDCDFPYISEETPRERIEAIPPADVQPVTHGQYIIDDMGDARCSVCGETELDVTKNFCPNCGADMRKPKTLKNASHNADADVMMPAT